MCFDFHLTRHYCYKCNFDLCNFQSFGKCTISIIYNNHIITCLYTNAVIMIRMISLSISCSHILRRPVVTINRHHTEGDAICCPMLCLELVKVIVKVHLQTHFKVCIYLTLFTYIQFAALGQS